MRDVFTLSERIAAVDDQIAEVEAMKRVREATGGARYCVFLLTGSGNYTPRVDTWPRAAWMTSGDGSTRKRVRVMSRLSRNVAEMTGWTEDELKPSLHEIKEGEKRKEWLSLRGGGWSRGEESLLVDLRQLFDALREVVDIRRDSGLSFEKSADSTLSARACEVTAKIRHERLRHLNDEIVRYKRFAMTLAMTGGWTAEHDAQLSALYEQRRRVYDERGADDE